MTLLPWLFSIKETNIVVMRMLYFLSISIVRCEFQLCFKVVIYYLSYTTACAGIMLFLLSVLGGDWMHVPGAQCSTTKLIYFNSLNFIVILLL